VPHVLFIPGFMQPGEAWSPVAERLPERYPSVFLEHREHTYEGRLREIAEAGEGGVIAGYSMGGRLALHAALRDSVRYRALVTVGASGGIDTPAARAARREADERLAAWMETASIDDIVAIWERQPLFADQSDALIEEQRPGRLSRDPLSLASLLRTAGQGALEPVWPLLSGLRLPFLALAGTLDARYSRAARRLASESANAQSRLVENAGHAAHLQRPDQVAELLVEFLDQHLGEGGSGDADP
jgi:2-succinyl-6-hydroxy-2,4-cyclohexadiene-1-carboxylate synthase